MIYPKRLWRLSLFWVVLIGTLLIESQTSGSGWLALLAAALCGIWVVAAAAPPIILLVWSYGTGEWRLNSPGDGQVGSPVTLYLPVGRWAQVCRVLPHGLPHAGRGKIPIVWTPGARGIVETLPLEVTNGSPLGIFLWARRFDAVLDPPLVVAPIPREGNQIDNSSSGDIPMQVRDWEPGDPTHAIHWPSTSRAGHLVIRSGDNVGELNNEEIRVVLAGDREQVENQASVWAWVIRRRLVVGPTWINTLQPAGRSRVQVSDEIQAGRSLATAQAES